MLVVCLWCARARAVIVVCSYVVCLWCTCGALGVLVPVITLTLTLALALTRGEECVRERERRLVSGVGVSTRDRGVIMVVCCV